MLSPLHRREDEGGIVAINLALFLGFALFAVVLLTRTTIAAQQIDDKVVLITKDAGGPAGIDQNLNEVPKLDLTNETAAKIKLAADPLSGDAKDIIDAAKSIDGTVTDILANAETINGTVKAINGNVGSIAASVRTIGGNATSLDAEVVKIRGNWGATGAPGKGVAGINNRVDIIINLATAIRGDLNNVNIVVGKAGSPNYANGKNINGHAATICQDLGASPCA